MTSPRFEFEDYGPNRKKLHFACPVREGHMCQVLLKPWPIQGAPTWNWDGNTEKPTLTPSINCGDCKWHGFITNGEIK